MIKCIKTCLASDDKKVSSPLELAKALAWNGGIQNSSVQLVKISRERPLKLKQAMQPCCDAASEFFSRASRIDFVDAGVKKSAGMSNPDAWEHVEFTVRVWACNGIGDGVLFQGCHGFSAVDEVPFADLSGMNALGGESFSDTDDEEDDLLGTINTAKEMVVTEDDIVDQCLEDIQ